MKARQLRQHLERGGVDRDVAAAAQKVACLALDVLRLDERGDGDAPGVERAADDERALRDEERLRRVGAAEQLVFGEPRVDIQLRRGKVRDFDDIGHGDPSAGLKKFSPYGEAYPLL